MSLRMRLIVSYFLIVVLCLGVVAGAVSVIIQGYRDRIITERLDDIARPLKEQGSSPPSRTTRRQKDIGEEKETNKSVFHPSPGVELNLRGQTADEALPNLEHHLELAYLAGLPFVHIIHGKGTGRLRQVVRQALRSSAHVTSWVAGSDAEGGEGVTIARLATE